MYGACDLVNYKPFGASSHMHTSYELHSVDRRECIPLDDLRMSAGGGCRSSLHNDIAYDDIAVFVQDAVVVANQEYWQQQDPYMLRSPQLRCTTAFPIS